MESWNQVESSFFESFTMGFEFFEVGNMGVPKWCHKVTSYNANCEYMVLLFGEAIMYL